MSNLSILNKVASLKEQQKEHDKYMLNAIVASGFMKWFEGTSITESEIIEAMHKYFVINSNGVWEKRK